MLALGVDLVRAGCLTDIPDRPIYSVLGAGLSRWLESMTGPLRVIDLVATLHPRATDILPGDVLTPCTRSVREGTQKPCVATTLDLAQEALTMGIGVSMREDLLVGDRVEFLEQACKGLGWTALAVAEEFGLPWGVIGRSWAFDVASRLFWAWSDSEAGYEDATGEPAADCGLLRAEFDAAYPVGKYRAVGSGRLRGLVSHENPLVRDAAAAILDLRRLAREACPVRTLALALHDAEVEYSYIGPEPSVLLAWRDFALAYRIGDDLYEYEVQDGSGYLPALTAICFHADEPLQRAEKVWAVALRRLGALDRLLSVIGNRSGE
jgi:hypothetical protein